VPVEEGLSRLVHAINEMLEHVQMFSDLSSTTFSDDFWAEWQATTRASHDLLGNVTKATRSVNCTRNPLLLRGKHVYHPILPATYAKHNMLEEYELIEGVIHHFKHVTNRLVHWSSKEPLLRPILSPVHEWVVTLPSTIPSKPDIQRASQNIDHMIDTLLVTVQSLISTIPEPDAEQLDGGADGFVKATSALLGRVTELLHLQAVITKLNAVFDQLALCAFEEIQRITPRIIPFVLRYEQFVRNQLSMLVNWTESIFRLEHVVCSVALTVATKGFCKPPDGEEVGEDGDAGEAMGGVGLGEGTGTENVSKEIEDESQVEGLQGEQDTAEQQQREKGEEDGKDAIEMGQDFEGEMEDAPDAGEEDGEDGEEDGEEGPEDKVGDLDPLDPSAVDEKLWGDEKGPEGKDDGGKTKDDRSKEQGADSEMVAKEKDNLEENERGEKGQEQSSAREPEDASMEEGGGDDEMGEADPAGEGAPVDDFVQDANTLDLPDELDIGREDKEDGDVDDDDLDDDGLDCDGDLPEHDLDDGGLEPDNTDAMDEDGDGNQLNAARTDEPDAPADDETEENHEGGVTAEPDVQTGVEGASDAANTDSLNTEARKSAPQNQPMSTSGGGTQNAGEGADAPGDDGFVYTL
jgi:midasin